jgi:hypothetical protein
METGDGRALIRRFYDLLAGCEPADWIELWHADGVFEQPFATEGFPTRLEGREAIRRHVEGMDRIFRDFRFLDLEMMATEDPSRFVATLRSDSTVISTERRYANEYVALFHLREGLVYRYREYFNPLVVLDAFGDTGTLNSSFGIGA